MDADVWHMWLSPQLIHEAYRQHGYRLAEIATHLGVHYATVSRQLKRAEHGNICLQDLTPMEWIVRGLDGDRGS